MISAVDDHESVIRCIEAGADDHLPKPFNPVLLRARINAGLARRRLLHARARPAARHVRALPARGRRRGAAAAGRRPPAARWHARRRDRHVLRPAGLHVVCRAHAARSRDRGAQPLPRRDDRRGAGRRRHARRLPGRRDPRDLRRSDPGRRPRRPGARGCACDVRGRAFRASTRGRASEGLGGRVPDGRRAAQRLGHVRQRRLGAPPRVHGDRGHGQHGLAHRAADQGVPVRRTALR